MGLARTQNEWMHGMHVRDGNTSSMDSEANKL